jgi:hypothetical protein
MKEDSTEKINPLRQKLLDLNELIKKGIYNNRNTYLYGFNKWTAETLYIFASMFGEKSKEYSRLEKSAKLPAGRAKQSQWIQYRKSVMIRTYAELEAILSASRELTRSQPAKPEEKAKPESRDGKDIEQYIDSKRMAQLRSIKSENFDLSKLIALCEELNKCYANGCYVAVAMLARAIVDHVPPIFNSGTFTDVANTYPGSRSFKESMSNLDKSLRKIADAHLHVQIRPSEILPSKTQIHFSPDLDVLLGEIVRILK